MSTVQEIWARARHEWWQRLPLSFKRVAGLRAASDAPDGHVGLITAGLSAPKSSDPHENRRHEWWAAQPAAVKAWMPGFLVAPAQPDADAILGSGGAPPEPMPDADYATIQRYLPKPNLTNRFFSVSEFEVSGSVNWPTPITPMRVHESDVLRVQPLTATVRAGTNTSYTYNPPGAATLQEVAPGSVAVATGATYPAFVRSAIADTQTRIRVEKTVTL